MLISHYLENNVRAAVTSCTILRFRTVHLYAQTPAYHKVLHDAIIKGQIHALGPLLHCTCDPEVENNDIPL